MDARVVWKKEGMQFSGISDKQHIVAMGSKDEPGTSPMEMLLMGLGGCTAMDCILVLQKKRMQVDSFEIMLHGERAETYPQKFTRIQMEYIFTGDDLDKGQVERAVELSANKYCSVKGSLDPAIDFDIRVTIQNR